jgi:hypothetical protein
VRYTNYISILATLVTVAIDTYGKQRYMAFLVRVEVERDGVDHLCRYFGRVLRYQFDELFQLDGQQLVLLLLVVHIVVLVPVYVFDVYAYGFAEGGSRKVGLLAETIVDDVTCTWPWSWFWRPK